MSRREKAFWLIVGAALVIGFIFLIPAHEQICEQGKEANQKDCPSYHVALIATRRVAEFFDVHNWLVTALFAGLVTMFTWRLWQATIELGVSTDRLWDAGEKQRLLSEKTAERQLRAYIGVEPRGVRKLVGKSLLVGHIAIRNVGNIPAKEISMFAVTDWYLNGSQKVFKIGELYKSKTALPPRAEMIFGTSTCVDADLIERDAERPSVLGGFIFVYGKVTYTDEFNTVGWTEFCHRYPCEMMEGFSIRRKYARYHELGGNDAG